MKEETSIIINLEDTNPDFGDAIAIKLSKAMNTPIVYSSKDNKISLTFIPKDQADIDRVTTMFCDEVKAGVMYLTEMATKLAFPGK